MTYKWNTYTVSFTVLMEKTYGICKRGNKHYFRNYKRELKNGNGMGMLEAAWYVSHANMPIDFSNVFNNT